MVTPLVRVLAAFGVAVALVSCGMQGAASGATWWPAATVFSRPARIGLAANSEGGFLLVDGRIPSKAAFCAPAGATFALGGPPPQGFVYGGGAGSVIPGSPSFEPDGRSVGMFLWQELHTEPVELLEGSSSAPAALSPSEPLGASVLSTNVFVNEPAVMSATGTRGDLAVADRPDTSDVTSIAVRPAGSTQWSRETLPAGAPLTAYSYSPKALAVDGFGDTTVLVNTVEYPDYHVEIASAYFAPPGGSFTALAVPGNYFTAIASDVAGRSAIAGYTPAGPDGPGLYLSRRESPQAPFGAPLLLSSLSSDAHPQLAYDASGVLTVAWNEGSRIAVTTAAPGEPVGPAHVLAVPGTTTVSDEQLSVDGAGEAILAWAGGPHEQFQGSQLRPEVLYGAPAPLFAAVRRSDSGPFGEAQQLTASAVYSAGLYGDHENSEARAVDAISSGRAMVAWLEEGATAPQARAALYAAAPGCASPPAPAVVPAVVPAAPTITSLSESARTWREGNALARISASKGKKFPVGTTFAFVLNVPASVTFTFTEAAGGRRVGAKCVAQTPKNRHRRRCTRTVIVGTMTFPAHAGTSKLRFQGLTSRHKRLKPGSYALLVTAAASGKRSTTRTLHFTIANR